MRFRSATAFALIMIMVATASCQDRTRTRRVVEEFAVVPGTPTVDSKTPQVLRDDTAETDTFGINVPRQCDSFQQVSVRKVDILWVVDSSGSMAPKQARLAANFQGFMNQLVNAQPPIDFHIAVTTTDTDNLATLGKLREWNLGSSKDDFIACEPNVGSVICNTGGGATTAVSAFTQMSQVGTSGSPHERGLYAAYLALTNPLNVSTAAVPRFVRPDAALYVVFVSDEDDASCAPLTRQSVCTADPGCRCALDQALQATGGWGSTEYFVRFFETFKGYGNQDSVAVAAIVATLDDAGVPSQFGDPSPHVGCCRTTPGHSCTVGSVLDGGAEVAYFGGRYAQVAAATGGVSVDICQDDFSNALATLGFSASGLRRDFRLTRGPDLGLTGTTATGLDVFVSPPNAANCSMDGNCPSGQRCRAGRCARRFDVTVGAPSDVEYVKCDSAGLRNIVTFDGNSVPESFSAVEICYDVLASFQNSCP